MELLTLRTKGTRFCKILQSIVISRLKFKDQILLLLITIPGDLQVKKREIGKIKKYKVLKDEIARMCTMKEVIIISVVVGALCAISTGFEKYITAIRIEIRVEHLKSRGQEECRDWYHLDAKKASL